MSEMGVALLKGESGESYHFFIYSLDDDVKNIGAVYAITNRVKGEEGGDFYRIFYIGHTSKLANSIAKRKNRPMVKQYNCDCVFIHPEPDKEGRLEKFNDIIQNYNSDEMIPEQSDFR